MKSNDQSPEDSLEGNGVSESIEYSLDSSVRSVNTPEAAENWEPPTLEHMALLLPQYEIEFLIGRGGMGAVYKGRQISLNRPVAIKLLPAELAKSADFVARFHREAQLLASLNHQGIVAIFDFGQTSEGHLYFVMEYVDGTDLHLMIHKTHLDAAQALNLMVQICEAMQYAHDMGVIHRDIKPANVVVTRGGRAKLADFGLAMKPAEHLLEIPVPPKPDEFDSGDPLRIDSLRLTRPGTAMGTPAYAAPEVYEGRADARSDIFALGIMLYEMLTGAPPRGYYQLPSTQSKVDYRIDVVIVKALEADPVARYQKASDMKLAVEAATRPLPRQTASTRPTGPGGRRPPPPPLQRPLRRRLGRPAVFVLVLLGAGVAYDAGQQWTVGKGLLAFVTGNKSDPAVQPVEIATAPANRALPKEIADECQRYLDAATASDLVIIDDEKKALAISEDAIAQARIGNADGAKVLAESIPIAAVQGKALAGIAAAQAVLGKLTDARATVDSIKDIEGGQNAMATISLALAETGALVDAEKLLQSVSDASDRKIEAAIAIANAHAAAGDVAGYRSALEGARAIVAACADPDRRAVLHKFMVLGLAKAGDFIAAQDILKLIPNDGGHKAKTQCQEALMHLAIAQSEAGDVEGANATINTTEWYWARDGGLLGLCEAHAKHGDTQAARAIEGEIFNDFTKPVAPALVAAFSGDLEASKSMISTIKHDGWRKYALLKVAAFQAEKDGFAAAERWIATLSSPEERHACYLKLVESRLISMRPVAETSTSRAAVLAKLEWPSRESIAPQSPMALAGFEKTLRSYSWRIPERDCVVEFKDNHEASIAEAGKNAVWHWWIIGPRTLHIQSQGMPSQFDPTLGDTWVYDESMMNFDGDKGRGMGVRHQSLESTSPKPAVTQPGGLGSTLFTSISLGSIANHPLVHLENPPSGRITYAGVPFEFLSPHRYFMSESYWSSDKPTVGKLQTAVPHPQSVNIIVVAHACSYSAFGGKEVGTINFGFSDGSEYQAVMRPGVTLRPETWQSDDNKFPEPTGDEICKFINVLSEPQALARGKPSKGFLDLLVIDLPESKAETVLSSITITDTSRKTVKTLDPGFGVVAITVGSYAAPERLKPRTFTDTNGRTLEGIVLSVKDDRVTLKIPKSGQKFILPITKFCPADIAYLKDFDKPMPAGTKPP